MADVVAQGLLIMIIDGPEALPTGVLLIGKPLLLFPLSVTVLSISNS